jgi:hypothetical protein
MANVECGIRYCWLLPTWKSEWWSQTFHTHWFFWMVLQRCWDPGAKLIKTCFMLEHWNIILLVQKSWTRISSIFPRMVRLFYNTITGLMTSLGAAACQLSEWGFFIDSFKSSLKGVLLHNSDRCASVWISHLFHIKRITKMWLLKDSMYKEHAWIRSGHLGGGLEVCCLVISPITQNGLCVHAQGCVCVRAMV